MKKVNIYSTRINNSQWSCNTYEKYKYKCLCAVCSLL